MAAAPSFPKMGRDCPAAPRSETVRAGEWREDCCFFNCERTHSQDAVHPEDTPDRAQAHPRDDCPPQIGGFPHLSSSGRTRRAGLPGVRGFGQSHLQRGRPAAVPPARLSLPAALRMPAGGNRPAARRQGMNGRSWLGRRPHLALRLTDQWTTTAAGLMRP